MQMSITELRLGEGQRSPPPPSAASTSSTSSRNSYTVQSAHTPPTSVFSTPDATHAPHNPLDAQILRKEPQTPALHLPPSPSSSLGEQSTSTGHTMEAKDGLSPLPTDSGYNPWAGRLPLPSTPIQMGLSELLSGGSPLSSPSDDSGSHRPSYFSRAYSYGDRPSHQRKSSTAEQDLALAANRDSQGKRDSPGPSSILSETSTRSSNQSGTPRLPRVRNTGGILAPHGTFSSSRPTQREQILSSTTSSSSRERRKILTPMDLPRNLTSDERRALEAASRAGDQLALRLLGYSHAHEDERHTLGFVDDVWGPPPASLPMKYRSSRSSVSSRSQPELQSPPPVDLLDEAVKLASRPMGRQPDSNDTS